MKALNKIVLAAIMIPMSFGMSSAFAAGNGKGPHRDDHQPMCHQGGEQGMFRALNLTPEQRDKIRAIRQTERDQIHARMQTVHQQRDKILLAKDFDAEAARDLAKKMVDEQINRRVSMMRHQHDVLNVLTPEQQGKWLELRQNKRFHCNDERGQFRGDGRAPMMYNGTPPPMDDPDM